MGASFSYTARVTASGVGYSADWAGTPAAAEPTCRRRRRRRRGSQRQLPMGVLIARGQTLALETLRLCRQCAAVAYGPLRRFADMKESVMAVRLERLWAAAESGRLKRMRTRRSRAAAQHLAVAATHDKHAACTRHSGTAE